MSWRERVEELCYPGETIVRRFELGDALFVVTSHRLLAFTPAADGADFRAIDRPNVAGVRIEASGYARLLRWAAYAALLGVAALALAASVSFAGALEAAAIDAGDAPVPGVAGTLETLTAVLALLDAVVFWTGVGGTVLAIVLIGAYGWTRTKQLVVAVPGEDDLVVPLQSPPRGLAASIEAAIDPGAEPTAETGATEADAESPSPDDQHSPAGDADGEAAAGDVDGSTTATDAS